MATITIAPSMAAQIKRLFTKHRHSSKATKPRTQRTIIDMLAKPSQRIATPLPIQSKTLWRIINTAIITGQLDLATLTDRPSELSNGYLYLSHERITGLLDDLELPLADMSVTEFNAIMTVLVGELLPIQSEVSTSVNGLGEERIAYRLPIATLINLNQPSAKAQLAEVASC